MNRFWKTLVVLPALLVLAATSSLFADHRLEYGGWNVHQAQTRNIPAGSVVDPGAQLLHFVDSGVNLLRPSQFTTTDRAQKNVFQLTGGAVTGKGATVLTNFLAVTNAHPTQAVTVHVRYFNDQCEDLLDFLVVLTCNDSLIFNPFDFQIPGVTLGGTAINTAERIFGPDRDVSIFPAIKGDQFRSGRFLIFITASGTSTDADDVAELLFPRELITFTTTGTITPTTGVSCANIVNATVGSATGAVATNLHVFNASAISFNYLIGHQTTAVPKGFIKGAQSDQDKFLAYGVNAWIRPAVDIALGLQATNIFDGHGDGDGASPDDVNESGVDKSRILTGLETVKQSDRSSNITANTLYFRNEVHGGDTDGPVNDQSHYGALAWSAIHGGTENINQKVDFISIVDDYNGSNNSAALNDRSYNVGRAETRYVLQIYDNKEQLFDIPPGVTINISPIPPTVTGVFLHVYVDCLRIWVSERVASLEVDDLGLDDLSKISANILSGGGSNTNFAGLNAVTNDVVDASKGWIRFVRDNVARTDTTLSPTTRRGTQAMGASTDTDGAGNPSFATIGQVTVRFEGFGASWWLSSSPFDARVSETSDPTPPRAAN